MRIFDASFKRIVPLFSLSARSHSNKLPRRSNNPMAIATTVTMTKSKSTQASKPNPIPFTPLQQRWTTLYTMTLPQLAASHGEWPVNIDHCFARIILDNAVGIDRPWPQVVTAPATRNMTQAQLKACVTLGDKVANREVDLWDLDEKSLKLRGKKPKARPAKTTATQAENKKRKVSKESHADADDAKATTPKPPAAKKSRKDEAAENWSAFSLISSVSGAPAAQDTAEEEAETLPDIRHIIASATELTPFRRDALTFLTQVPRGRYTTYQALSNAISKVRPNVALSSGSDKARASGCARAVGSAMRTNPFAPSVPCHRVLASDGKIGGFKGDWGTEGRFYNEKIRLLTEEGVRFDANGKVIGPPFTAFTV